MIDLLLNFLGLEKTPVNQYKELFIFYKICIFFIIIYNIIYNSLYNKKQYIGFILFKYNYIFQYIILTINLYKIENNNNFNYILSLNQILIIIKTSLILYFNIKILNIHNIILNIGEFIGSYIYFNSIIIFVLLLIKINQYIKDIKDNIDNLDNNESINIINVYEQLMINKYKISKIISNFNYIFNFFTLINIVSIGVCYENYDYIKHDRYLFYSYLIFVGYFILVELLCITIILYSRFLRENILSELHSPIFINSFIKKNDLNSLNNKFNLNIEIDDINIDNNIIYNKIYEIQKTNDWTILYISLNNKWIEFKICGIEIHSIDSICKVLLYTSILYKLLF